MPCLDGKGHDPLGRTQLGLERRHDLRRRRRVATRSLQAGAQLVGVVQLANCTVEPTAVSGDAIDLGHPVLDATSDLLEPFAQGAGFALVDGRVEPLPGRDGLDEVATPRLLEATEFGCARPSGPRQAVRDDHAPCGGPSDARGHERRPECDDASGRDPATEDRRWVRDGTRAARGQQPFAQVLEHQKFEMTAVNTRSMEAGSDASYAAASEASAMARIVDRSASSP